MYKKTFAFVFHFFDLNDDDIVEKNEALFLEKVLDIDYDENNN